MYLSPVAKPPAARTTRPRKAALYETVHKQRAWRNHRVLSKQPGLLIVQALDKELRAKVDAEAAEARLPQLMPLNRPLRPILARSPSWVRHST